MVADILVVINFDSVVLENQDFADRFLKVIDIVFQQHLSYTEKLIFDLMNAWVQILWDAQFLYLCFMS